MNHADGFTLMEILVAFAVLASGLSAVAIFHGSFNRMSAREASRAEAVVAGISYVERSIENPAPCADTSFVCAPPSCAAPLRVSRSRVNAEFQWVEVEAGPYMFRRLLRCVAASR